MPVLHFRRPPAAIARRYPHRCPGEGCAICSYVWQTAGDLIVQRDIESGLKLAAYERETEGELSEAWTR